MQRDFWIDLNRHDDAAGIFRIEGKLGDASDIDAVVAHRRSPAEAGNGAGEYGSVVGELLPVLRARARRQNNPESRDEDRWRGFGSCRSSTSCPPELQCDPLSLVTYRYRA